MQSTLRKLRFNNEVTFFTSQASFSAKARKAAKQLLKNPTITAIKDRMPKDKK